MHLLSKERNDVLQNDLVRELDELADVDAVVVVDVQLLEVAVVVFLRALDAFESKVAFDQLLKFLTVDLPVMLLVRSIKQLLYLGKILSPHVVVTGFRGNALEVQVLTAQGVIVHINQIVLCHF